MAPGTRKRSRFSAHPKIADLDLRQVWSEARDPERRVLVDDPLDRIIVYPDHLEVVVHGVPKINVLLSEVGLAESQNKRVGGLFGTPNTQPAPLRRWCEVRKSSRR